jgi:hypothetical protein
VEEEVDGAPCERPFSSARACVLAGSTLRCPAKTILARLDFTSRQESAAEHKHGPEHQEPYVPCQNVYCTLANMVEAEQMVIHKPFHQIEASPSDQQPAYQTTA